MDLIILYNDIGEIEENSIKFYQVSETYTCSVGRSRINVPYTLPSGSTVLGCFVERSPNPNWVFGYVYNDSLSSSGYIHFDYFNSYSSEVSGNLVIGILYK